MKFWWFHYKMTIYQYLETFFRNFNQFMNVEKKYGYKHDRLVLRTIPFSAPFFDGAGKN